MGNGAPLETYSKARDDIACASGGWRYGLLRSRADAPKLDVGCDADFGRRNAGGGVAPRGSTAAAQTAETASVALDVLWKSVSVDIHTHGGTTGITSKAPPSEASAS